MICHNCGVKGHIRRACTSPLPQKTSWNTDPRQIGSASLEVAVVGVTSDSASDDKKDERPVSDVSSNSP